MGQIFDSLFGDIYNDSTFHARNQAPTRPIWVTLLEEDDEATLNHLWQLYYFYYETAQGRIERMRYNLCSFVGLNYFPSEIRLRAIEGMRPEYIGTTPKITTALIQKMVQDQVTQALLNPSEISVTAVGTDFKNSLHAELAKEILDAYERRFNDNRAKEEMSRKARIMGEAYRHTYWNRDKGPLDKTYLERKAAGKPVQILLENGELVEVQRPVYQGDIDEDILQSWDVGIDQRSKLEFAQWGFHRYLRPTDELRVDYPSMADDLESTKSASDWSSDMMAVVPLRDHTLAVDFYFRSSPYLPFGYYARITPNCICEQGPNPHEDTPGNPLGNIPYDRLTDLDIDGSIHGWSRIQNLQQGQNQYDNTTTLIGRNIFIGAHPKWMLPKGAANIQRLNNNITVVPYSGPIKPELVVHNTVPAEALTYRASHKDDMEYVYGSNPISRGEPPKGVTANAALQFLDTQAQEANTLQTVKYDQHTVFVYGRRLSILASFTDKDDERYIKVLGEDQGWYMKFVDIKALNNAFEIGLQVASDLPKRKDAKMQTVFQMSQIWPSMFPPEAVADMFKLGHVNKFLSAAAAAYKAAERENWLAAHGEKLEDPMEWEDMIVHWRTHKKQLQMAQFRRWPESEQKELLDHLLVTELKMLRKMRKQPFYGPMLQQLGDWPLLCALPDDFGRSGGPPQANPQAPPEQGQGTAEKTGEPSLNQQRFQDGKFGQGRQPIAA